MTKEVWIALADYSLKYKVSISTLRRRIKNQDVEVRVEDGKYLLLDAPFEVPRKGTETSAPPQRRTGPVAAAPQTSPPQGNVTPTPPPVSSSDRAEVQLLLAELKKAYTLILQEKEQLILQLKGEVADLKTLTRVLEGENERLKDVIKDSSSLDQWLKSPPPR